MKKMISKAIKGSEFIYSRRDCWQVPTASAQAICDALNKLKHKLKDGETWHIYDCGPYELEFTSAMYQKITHRAGKIYFKQV